MSAVRVKGEASPGWRRPLTRPDGEAATGKGSRRPGERDRMSDPSGSVDHH